MIKLLNHSKLKELYKIYDRPKEFHFGYNFSNLKTQFLLFTEMYFNMHIYIYMQYVMEFKIPFFN